jgi:hypothetical protein
MRTIIQLALLIGFLNLASQGQAQTPPPGEVQVPVSGGQEVRMLALNNTAGECSGFPIPEVRISEPPRSGTIIVRYGVSRFPENAPQCAGRGVPGLGVYYRPNPGFSGRDRARIESGAAGQPSLQGQTFNLAVTP